MRFLICYTLKQGMWICALVSFAINIVAYFLSVLELTMQPNIFVVNIYALMALQVFMALGMLVVHIIFIVAVKKRMSVLFLPFFSYTFFQILLQFYVVFIIIRDNENIVQHVEYLVIEIYLFIAVLVYYKEVRSDEEAAEAAAAAEELPY